MKKQRIQLLIMLVLLVVFASGYFGLKAYNKNAEAKASEPKYTALALDEDSAITELKVTNVNGEFDLVKQEDDTWILSSDPTLDIDETKITTKLNNLKTITSEQVVDGAENLADFGLDDPAITVQFTLADGTSHILKIGDYNNVSSTYYLLVDDISTVYTVNSGLNYNFSFAQDAIVAEETSDATEETTVEETTSEKSSETTDETPAD
ncbi:MAG: DUF4340 domain-containing protein [Butyrivibrio sp.]|nr:DUF4340 domain-containing protein [Butyrivibrio sp.]